MRLLFTQDIEAMSSRMRTVALWALRIANLIAPILCAGLVAVGVVHFLAEVGNYPEAKHRHTVGVLFLGVFAPTTLTIAFVVRRRLRELRAFAARGDGIERGGAAKKGSSK